MIHTKISLICFCAIAFNSYGQKMLTTYHKDSTLVLTRDARVDELMARQKDSNTLRQSMNGYRVQIYFGSVRQKASEVKLDFTGKHPEIMAYLTYSAPNFKVRVGDFSTRLQAQKLFKSIEGQYPTCFIVPDEVRLPAMK